MSGGEINTVQLSNELNQKQKLFVGVIIPVVERSRNDNAGSVDREVELALLLAVKNGYIDYYIDNDLFDLSYADVGQPTPNFIFYSYPPLKTATLSIALIMIFLI